MLDIKSTKSMFIRYSVDDFEYRFWDEQSCKIILRKDIIFNKHVIYKDNLVQ